MTKKEINTKVTLITYSKPILHNDIEPYFELQITYGDIAITALLSKEDAVELADSIRTELNYNSINNQINV